MTEHLRNVDKQRTSISGVVVGKYITVLVLLLFIVWIAVFKSGSTKPFAEVSQAVQDSIEDEELIQRTVRHSKNIMD